MSLLEYVKEISDGGPTVKISLYTLEHKDTEILTFATQCFQM